MTTLNMVTLRPTADFDTGANWGTLPLYTALADNTNGTWATSLSWPDDFTVELANYTDPSFGAIEARIKEIRIRAKVGFTDEPNRDLTVLLLNGISDIEESAIRVPGTPVVSAVGGTPVVEDYYGPWMQRNNNGALWTKAQVDALRLKVETTFSVNVYAVYLDVNYYYEPSAAFVEPNYDSKALGHFPTFRWSFSNGGVQLFGGLAPILTADPGNINGTQKKYEIRLYTNAQVNAAIFAADVITDDDITYPPVAASGIVPSARALHSFTTMEGAFRRSPISGAANQFHVFLRVAKDYNGTDWWSEWVSRDFLTGDDPSILASAVADTTVSRPVIEWTFPGFVVQNGAELYIFSDDKPYPVDPGVEPDDALCFAEVTGDVQEAKCDMSFPPGDYRAYVRARDVRWGEDQPEWTNWDFVDFTLSYDRPNAPTLALTVLPASASIRVDVSWNGAGGTILTMSNLEVERRVGLTGEWTPFYSDDGPWLPGPIAIPTDYEAPFNQAIYYRARVSEPLGNETRFSDWSAATMSSGLDLDVIWLKNPSFPAMNARFRAAQSWLETETTKRRAVHHPLGRSLPMAMKSEGRGEVGEITFTVEDDEVQALIDLLDCGDRLLLQMPKRQLYIDVRENYAARDHLQDLRSGETDIRQVTVPFVEVG